MADPCNLERGLLYRFAQGLEIPALDLRDRGLHDSRPAYADIYDGVRFGNAVERPRHEGVVVRRIAEYHKLRASYGVPVRRSLRRTFYDIAHEPHGVHVYPYLRCGDLDGTANPLRASQSLRYGVYQHPVRPGHALRHQCRVPAYEIDTYLLRSPFQSMCYGDEIIGHSASRGPDDAYRGDGDPLVDYGDPVLQADVLCNGDQVPCGAYDLVVYLLIKGIQIRVAAFHEAYAHGDRSYVQILPLDHLVGLEDLVQIYHAH
ncbi:hypothetical protein SDC9_139340 [bioreactor metagenome]|uniref:Uncharacterized protein n=1 Tax=bioreactor metagenome TaxID=1076179 RepID=A0A645DSG7_9ZZZZ